MTWGTGYGFADSCNTAQHMGNVENCPHMLLMNKQKKVSKAEWCLMAIMQNKTRSYVRF